MSTFRYKLWSWVLLVTGFLGGWAVHTIVTVHAQEARPFVVTHIFTGADGQTRTEQLDLPMTPSATPRDRGTLDAALAFPAKQVQIVRTSPDYVDNFHTVGTRRYVIMLSGHREYEVAGGRKFPMGPGGVMLVEDLTGTGHLTRGVGEDAVSMIVTLGDTK